VSQFFKGILSPFVRNLNLENEAQLPAEAQVPAQEDQGPEIAQEDAQVPAEDDQGPEVAQVLAAEDAQAPAEEVPKKREAQADIDKVVFVLQSFPGVDAKVQMKNALLAIVAERPDRNLNIGLLEKGWQRGKYYYSKLLALIFLTRELNSLSRIVCIQ
jgi:hypothetical protein